MLICDKRRPRTRGDTNIRPPQGGRIKTAPPASGPRLGRSSAWGGTPPDPLGCAPWCAFAHRAPAASVTQPEGFRARVRRWRGWASRRLVHARRLAPSLPLGSVFQKAPQGRASGEGSGGACPPRQGGGGQPGPGGGRPGCSRRLCPPSTDWARLSTGDRATVRSACATRYPPAAGAPPCVRDQ